MPMPPADPSKPMTANSSGLKELMSQVDQILGPKGGAPGSAPAEAAPVAPAMGGEMGGGPVTPEDDEEMEGGVPEAEVGEAADVKPLMEALGVSEEKARALVAAAAEDDTLAGQSPQDLANTLSTDFEALMRLNQRIEQGESAASRAKQQESDIASLKAKKADEEAATSDY